MHANYKNDFEWSRDYHRYQVLTILYLYICMNKKNINYKYDNIYFKNIN